VATRPTVGRLARGLDRRPTPLRHSLEGENNEKFKTNPNP